MTQVLLNNQKIFLIHKQNSASLLPPDFQSQTNFREISHYSTSQTLDAVYVIGGWATMNIVAEFKNDRWRRLADLNQGRRVHGSITIEGQAMIIGGAYTGQT